VDAQPVVTRAEPAQEPETNGVDTPVPAHADTDGPRPDRDVTGPNAT
jgi:hypothetical protein